MSNRTGTNSYKCWAVLKLFAYWPEIEIMSSELGTQPVACRTTCSHCETRQHISNYRRYAHEFERHQFNKPSKFVRNKIRTRFLKTFEIIAAAFAITCDIKRHLFNMRLCSSPTRHLKSLSRYASPLATTCCSSSWQCGRGFSQMCSVAVFLNLYFTLHRYFIELQAWYWLKLFC